MHLARADVRHVDADAVAALAHPAASAQHQVVEVDGLGAGTARVVEPGQQQEGVDEVLQAEALGEHVVG